MAPTYDEAFEDLAEIYLEDSWVLDVGVRAGALVFDLDAVLTERHPRYRPPRPAEMYCYHRARLVIRSPRPISFRRSGRPPSRDPDGELDYGNIDVFAPDDDASRWSLDGDWGEAVVDSPTVELGLDP